MERDSTIDTIEPVENAEPIASPILSKKTLPDESLREIVRHKAMLVTQGARRFYSLVLPSKILAATSTVDARSQNPTDGFQRLLDKRRAREIARYIDAGFGAVPSAVILSAQPSAGLRFDAAAGALRFRKDPKSFLIIDGQHRIFGFNLAKGSVDVPVVIYNGLSRAEECRLFIDINTKQRPVAAELLLDIRQLSGTESPSDALLRQVFDLFNSAEDSALKEYLSPAERVRGKITRVTFNAALKPVNAAFAGAPAADVYTALNAYLKACLQGLRWHGVGENIAHPVLFKALVLLFPNVAERVADRYGAAYTELNFVEVLMPMFRRLKDGDLPRPGAGHLALHEYFRKTLSAGFSLKNWLFS